MSSGALLPGSGVLAWRWGVFWELFNDCRRSVTVDRPRLIRISHDLRQELPDSATASGSPFRRSFCNATRPPCWRVADLSDTPPTLISEQPTQKMNIPTTHISCGFVGAQTQFVRPGDHERFLEAGFDAYLDKPFTPEQLHKMLNQMLSSQDSKTPGRVRTAISAVGKTS